MNRTQVTTGPALWVCCSICGAIRINEWDPGNSIEPVPGDAHAKCDVAERLWLRREPFPEIPDGVPADCMPSWHVTAGARLRRMQRRPLAAGLPGDAAAPDLRVVS